MKQLILFILLIPTFYSFGQSTTAGVSYTTSAEEIISKVRKHYQSNQSFSADVRFTIDIPESQNQVMDGKIYLKGNKYKFVLNEQEIISDDVNLWHWNKGDINEVQVSYVQEDETVITPAKIFDEFLRGYSYKLDSTPTINGEKLALIEITPQSRNDFDDIFKVKVVTKLNSSTIKEMQIFTKDGTVYTFTVSNEKKAQLGNDLFTFNEANHPEVQVIDLR